MNRKYLIIIYGLFSFLSANAQKENTTSGLQPSEKYILGGVNVSGNTVTDYRLITSIAGLPVGGEITVPGDDITKAIQNLWKQKLFSDISILMDSVKGKKAYLRIAVVERPKLADYKFTGIGKAKAKRLKEEVKISNGKIVTEQLITATENGINNYYTKKGFPNSKVTITSVPDTAFKGNSVRLNVHVDPGKRLKISEIDFVGNDNFSDKRLRRTFKKTKQNHIYSFIKPSKLQREDLEEDEDKLESFYKVHGYKDIKVLSDSIVPVDESHIKLIVNLSEGQKYYYRNITWSGNTKYETRYLSSVLGIKKGDLYNPDVLDKNLYINQNGQDVTSLYMDDGYLFFSVTPVETRIENDSVDLEIRIYEGPQATINKVIVTGNDKTYDHVIMREIRTKPGMKFSRSDIIRTERELAQLGYFDQ